MNNKYKSQTSSSFRKNDIVEVLKPLESASHVFGLGTLLNIVDRKENCSSPLWKIKMENGNVDYCEENFLMRTSKKIEKTS